MDWRFEDFSESPGYCSSAVAMLGNCRLDFIEIGSQLFACTVVALVKCLTS